MDLIFQLLNSPSDNEKYLTGKLANLKRYNGTKMIEGHFDPIMQDLRKKFLRPEICYSASLSSTSNSQIARIINSGYAENDLTNSHIG